MGTDQGLGQPGVVGVSLPWQGVGWDHFLEDFGGHQRSSHNPNPWKILLAFPQSSVCCILGILHPCEATAGSCRAPSSACCHGNRWIFILIFFLPKILLLFAALLIQINSHRNLWFSSQKIGYFLPPSPLALKNPPGFKSDSPKFKHHNLRVGNYFLIQDIYLDLYLKNTNLLLEQKGEKNGF